MELCREVGVSFEAVAKEVRKLFVTRGMEANASTRIPASLDQQPTLLTELRN
jgi:hypothetical protein